MLTFEQGAQIARAYSAGGSRLGKPRVAADVTVTWDCVWFGNYWQEDTDGDGKATIFDDKQPIKWRVLSVDGNDAFLLADQYIDRQCYYEGRGTSFIIKSDLSPAPITSARGPTLAKEKTRWWASTAQ